MNIKGGIINLATFRHLYEYTDNFDFGNDFHLGLNGYDLTSLRKFDKKEFKQVIECIHLLDTKIFSHSNISDRQDFVVHFQNNTAEMDCVTFFNLTDKTIFLDIEVKETTNFDEFDEQFKGREEYELNDLNLNKNYILIGYSSIGFYKAILKIEETRIEFANINDFVKFINFKFTYFPAVIKSLREIESIQKIQEIKNNIRNNNFHYYIATRSIIESFKSNVANGKKIFIYYGNAGCGKTVIALSLFFTHANTKLLILNKLLYNSLNMGEYYHSQRCYFGSDSFISSLDKNTIAIVDESQRLSLADLKLIISKAKICVFLGDHNQAFSGGDSLLNKDELKDYLIKNLVCSEEEIVAKTIENTVRYNTNVNKLLEALRSHNKMNEKNNLLGEKIGNEYPVDITMSHEEFLSRYISDENNSRIYIPYPYPSGVNKVKIGDTDFGLVDYDNYFFSSYGGKTSLIGNTFHAISFDVDNSFVYLLNVGLKEIDGKYYLYDKKWNLKYKTIKDFEKFGNQINILFTRGRRSLHILCDDIYVFCYLNHTIMRAKK